MDRKQRKYQSCSCEKSDTHGPVFVIEIVILRRQQGWFCARVGLGERDNGDIPPPRNKNETVISETLVTKESTRWLIDSIGTVVIVIVMYDG